MHLKRLGFLVLLGLAPACGDDAEDDVRPDIETADGELDGVGTTDGVGDVDDVEGEGDVVAAERLLRVLAFNDFHGVLEPAQGPGAAFFAEAIGRLRDERTLVVSAGDLIGGSPFISGILHDEPTIEIMNAIGLDYAGVGNHEFDEGRVELMRMQNGGCHPADGCGLGDTFQGASFEFLAANVTDRTTGELILPAYALRVVGDLTVAIVGMTLEDTPAQTLPSAVTDLVFADEVDTMNALVPELQVAGADVIVLLLHESGSQLGGANECLFFNGPVKGIAEALDPAVSIVATGHSHTFFNCNLDGKVVTAAGAYGTHVTVIDVVRDAVTGQLVATAENVVVSSSGTPDPEVAALVADVQSIVAVRRDEVIATISETIPTSAGLYGESPMGAVIADAMLAASAAPAETGAEIALMNTGGVRAPLYFEPSAGEDGPGQVRYGEAFAVQPFSNVVSTVTLTGADVFAALDVWCGAGTPLQVAGITYSCATAAAEGARVSVLFDGEPLEMERNYRVTVNSIVIDPGKTPSMANATDVALVDVDLELLVKYLRDNSPVAAPEPRIVEPE